MRTMVLAGIFALSTSTSLAQTTTPPQPVAPAAEAPADQAAAPPPAPVRRGMRGIFATRHPRPVFPSSLARGVAESSRT